MAWAITANQLTFDLIRTKRESDILDYRRVAAAGSTGVTVRREVVGLEWEEMSA